VRRHVNIVVVGQSGVGKSHLAQSWGRCACVHGFRVRYTTSAELITKLKASLADHTLPRQLRGYSSFDLLIIDFGGAPPKSISVAHFIMWRPMPCLPYMRVYRRIERHIIIRYRDRRNSISPVSSRHGL
jgi:hypothetical protein